MHWVMVYRGFSRLFNPAMLGLLIIHFQVVLTRAAWQSGDSPIAWDVGYRGSVLAYARSSQ